MNSQDADLPTGWSRARLEDIVEVLDSRRKPVNAKERSLRPGSYPYYGANCQAGTIDDFIFEGPHTLLAEDGGNFDEPSKGVAYNVDGKFWVNNHAHVLQSRECLDQRLLVHLLNATNWMPHVGGSTRLKLNQGKMRIVELPIPPLNEQRRIVAKIEALQARSKKAREALEAIPPLLEKFRQSVLASAFRGDLTADWRAKNPDVEPATKLLERIRIERRRHWEESELAKMKAKGKTPKNDKWKEKYKEPAPVDTTDLPELPEGWCWAALEEFCDKITDGTHQPPPFADSGVPFLVIKNIVGGEIKWDTVAKWVSEDTHSSFTKRSTPEKGDILYTAVGSYGIAVEVKVDHRFMFQRHIAHLKPVRKYSNPAFIALTMNSPNVLAQAHSVARGVAQKTVTLGLLRRFVLPLPPVAEQASIVKTVKDMLNTRDAVAHPLSEAIEKVRSLDQSILAKAFRGELVPQDPNDEPASVLLERIKAEQANIEKPKRKTRKKKGRAS